MIRELTGKGPQEGARYVPPRSLWGGGCHLVRRTDSKFDRGAVRYGTV